MQNTLLVQTLLAFSPAERLEIKRFLTDSYFNRDKHAKQILRLFALLDDQIAQGEVADLSRDLLLEQISPDKKTSKGYLDNRMSDLLALLRKFIWLQEADNKAAHDLATARFYRARGLEGRAVQVLHQIPKRPEQSPKMVPDQLLLHFERELELSEIESSSNHREGHLNLPAALEALSIFYSHHFLQLAAALYQQEGYVPKLDTGWAAFIEPFRASLSKKGHFGSPVLEVFEQALRLVTRASNAPEQDLAHFVASVQQHESLLSEWSLKNLAAYARNFCSYHLQRGNPQLSGLLLSLYQEHLSKGWLYENGLLQPSSLINMVAMGLRGGQNDWVLQVLESHRNQIAHNEQEMVWSYCMAKYHFHLGNLAQASTFVKLQKQSQKQKDVEIEKSMRILSIQIAYEQWHIHLDTHLTAYAMFLNRNKSRLSAEKMQHNTHFISVVRRMTNLRNPQATQPKTPAQARRIQSLTLEVSAPAYQAAERKWLLQKIAQL